jgi:hypothetical protein
MLPLCTLFKCLKLTEFKASAANRRRSCNCMQLALTACCAAVHDVSGQHMCFRSAHAVGHATAVARDSGTGSS